MTNLGTAIDRIISKHPWGYSAKIARKVNVSPAYICRLRKGDRLGITPKVLARLAKALADSETERAEIIIAHLKDESCGYAPGIIEMRIKNGNTSGNKISSLKHANK